MKARQTILHIQKNDIVRLRFGTLGILLVPVILRFPWGPEDFLVMALLLLATGGGFAWIARHVDKKYRFVMGIVLVGIFLLVWAELAVGLFGSPLAGS